MRHHAEEVSQQGDSLYLNPFLQCDHVFALLVVLMFHATFLNLRHDNDRYLKRRKERRDREKE